MSFAGGYQFRGYADFYEVGDLANEIAHIVAEMGKGSERYPPLPLGEYEGDLWSLICGLRQRYLDEDDDLRRRAADEGSPQKPYRRLSRNSSPEETRFAYRDFYSPEDAERDWVAWWVENWYRPRGRPFWFTVPGHGGRKMMKPPLVHIYRTCNAFFRRVLGVEFFPIFKANDHVVSDAAAMPDLNPAARFFLLVAQAVDPSYTREHCKRVHDDCYHDLGIEGRRLSHHRA